MIVLVLECEGIGGPNEQTLNSDSAQLLHNIMLTSAFFCPTFNIKLHNLMTVTFCDHSVLYTHPALSYVWAAS